MERTAAAEWKGNLKDGSGTLTALSGAFRKLPYSFATRFGDQEGTNPEELIGAAHAGCFTMALSLELQKVGLKPDVLHTEATVTLSQDNAVWSVSEIHLTVYGRVPDGTKEQFDAAAKSAKENCPVSRLLNTRVTLETKFNAGGAEHAA